MFGSPNVSTPFGKGRALGASTPAMSFGQQSASKRKRDQMTPAPAEKANVYVKQLRQPVQNFDRDATVGRLFPRGQFIHRLSARQEVDFRPHFLTNPSDHVALNKMDIKDFNGTIDCGVGPSESFDVVSCSTSGRITIANVTADGTQTHFECSVHLQEENEQITECCHAGNVVMLGSTNEELYLIRRYGRSLTADRLQRNRSLFANLLTSGARFIGLKPAHSSGSRIVKALPVPLSCLLVSVGSSLLSIWSEWTNPGSEQVVWEHNLRDALNADVAALEHSRNSHLEIADAALMPVEVGAERATLLVLSAYYPDDAPRDSTAVSASLWLHTLEISIPTSAGALGNEAPFAVLHRLQLAEAALFKPFNSELTGAVGHSDHYIAPRICTMHPSWRVYLAWSGTSQAASAPGTGTLHAAQLDVLNQTLLNATAAFERSVRGAGSAPDALRCKNAVDSEISLTNVGALAAVAGTDGICIVHADGGLYLLSPPLPKRLAVAFPLQTSTVRDRQGPTDKTGQTEELAVLLHSAALGEVATEDATKSARDHFAASDPADALVAVQSASAKLLSRSSTGRYWAGAEGARTGPGGAAGALTRYQMVHRLVESKLNAHKQLLNIVSVTDAFDLDPVRHALLRDHQLLLLSAGLSGALEEAQLRLSSADASSTDAPTGAPRSAVSGASEALAVVAQGMERAVRVGRGRSLDEIDSQGLSVADIFYSESALVLDGVESIVQAVVDAQPTLARKGLLLETVFSVASIVLSALQFATVGDGAETAATFVGSNHKLRASLTTLVRMLKDATSAVEAPLGKSVVGDREGRRIRELCQSLLQGFAKELAGHAGCNVEDMSREWRVQYHHAKGLCSALMISTSQYQAGFALCSEHLYCLGLMESTDREPHLLRARLEEVLRHQGHVVGTDSVPLATGCFLWLEAHNRPADILSLGTASPVLLEEFLKTRHHLSWMHHLRSGHYAAATVAAVDTASTVPAVAKATTLLSIAKLSAKLAQSSDVVQASSSSSSSAAGSGSAAPKRLFTSAASSTAAVSSLPNQQVLQGAMTNMHSDLAVLRAQDIVADTLPNLGLDREVRVPVSELVKIVTRALAFHGAASVAAPVDMEGVSTHALFTSVPSQLVRCFGVALSLLSMQMDLLDALLKEVDETAPQSEEFGLQSRGERQDELRRQMAALDGMATQLWGALIAANTAAWLELACYPALGAQEEEEVLRVECWLHDAVLCAVRDSTSGNLREELIPADSSEQTDALLHKALEAAGIAHKRLNSEGEVESLPEGQTNQRIIHIVKICVGMALSARVDQQ